MCVLEYKSVVIFHACDTDIYEEKLMISMNGTRSNFLCFFSCNALYAGILTSAMIHAAVMLLLFFVPVTEVTPQLQIIQMSLAYQDTVSFDTARGTKQEVASKDNQAQNNISAKTFLKSAEVQKAGIP